MSNTHEYVVFDRAKVDRAITLRWPAFQKTYPCWGKDSQWDSARDFLVDWALDENLIPRVDEFLARKTVRATLATCEFPFYFFRTLIDDAGLTACDIDIAKYDYDYADEIVSCAAAGYLRGDLSFASLTAVCDLHLCRVDPKDHLPPNVAKAILDLPRRPMLPGLPHIVADMVDGIGVVQSRRFIAFLTRAWRERWPLQNDGKGGSRLQTIRSCEVAKELARKLGRCRMKRPCMMRWFEC